MPDAFSCPPDDSLRRSIDPDDPMPAEERSRIEEHVDSCELGCKWVLAEELREDILLLKPISTPSTESDQTGHACPEASMPSVPGYEILSELGRGGMGVVYRARQNALRRVVALKMLLRPADDSEAEDYVRFAREARAIACLNHANIVHVYEMGEFEGRPFISMELVEGGSLAERLAGMPQPARHSAAQAAILAEAVQIAHQQQIVHRDLKPGNILLTPVGTLKITDFGLAHQLDGESTETAGRFLGTASYAAPEQAAGQRNLVGPATDIYGLGAILYEMLTGRPPFRAATTWQTLQLVTSADPVSPRRLAPTPRDLDTICLKCLAKDPAQRYGSAQELADDLRRFLAEEPIRARPVSAWERTLKWSQRRPAVAALVGVSSLAVATVMVLILVANAHLQRERSQTDDRRREAEANLEVAKEQRRLAITNLSKARQAVDQMLTRVSDNRLKHLPHMETVQRQLLQDALAFYQDLARQSGNDDPDLVREMARAYRRAGGADEWLGSPIEAEDCFRHALALYEKTESKQSDPSTHVQELAACHTDLGRVLRNQQKYQEANEHLLKAMALQKALVKAQPEINRNRVALAATYNTRAVLLHETRKLDEEEEAYHKAETLLSEVVAADPRDVDSQAKLITVRTNFAEFLEEQQKFVLAESILRAALALAERAAELNPDPFEGQTKVALVLTGLGRVLDKRGQDHDAEDCYRRSAELRKKMVENFPSIPYFLLELARNLNLLAKLIARHPGREREAVQAASASVQYERTADKLSPHIPGQRLQLFELLSDFAEILLKTGDHTQAVSIAMELSTLAVRDKRGSYTGATILAKCMALVEKDAGLSPVQRTRLGDQYANQAIKLLAEALKKGETDTEKLQRDKAFAGLAGRPAFQEFVGKPVSSSAMRPK